ncbi:MAG TPA: GlxA family transcriptional regulator [Caulobacteraceae bacterium]|nr:GlxA family transcriptional regulator [Caulobacteraceae bacterium]
MTATIGFLIYPGFQLLDAAGPIGAFEMPMRTNDPAPYALKVLAKEAGLVRSSAGVGLPAEAMDESGPLDTLVVAGGWGVKEAIRCEATLDFIRRQARTARRVTSVCSGSMLLAAAGLLDGRRATCHWGRSRQFPRLFPNVKFEPDRIWTRDGKFWTSAGVTAGIDLALALIAEDLGEETALRTAQELVVYRRRPGGQSQFSALLEMERPDGRFSALLGWMRENLQNALTVEELADRAHMSPRNFARAFTAETGMTPAKAVERLRVEAARQMVEGQADPIDRIAVLVGFSDPERMRRAFIRGFGQPPQALRRAARAA